MRPVEDYKLTADVVSHSLGGLGYRVESDEKKFVILDSSDLTKEQIEKIRELLENLSVITLLSPKLQKERDSKGNLTIAFEKGRPIPVQGIKYHSFQSFHFMILDNLPMSRGDSGGGVPAMEVHHTQSGTYLRYFNK